MRARCWIVILALAAGASACTATSNPSVFTTAHTGTGSAVRDFFLIRPAASQPIEVPHQTHVEKAMLKCTETCHESVVKGPQAGIPSVKTCMICHDSIATDRDRI